MLAGNSSIVWQATMETEDISHNNKKVMWKFTNKRWSNILGSITLLLMSVAGVALIYFQFK